MIFSVGYGTRKFKDFIVLLKKYNIEYLIDVRSKPFSMSNPEFSREPLMHLLYQHEITYVFFGNELGGRPDDESCYTNGKVDYNLLEQKSFYKKGIERIKSAFEQGFNVAIMCSESKPEECHRSKLIGTTLVDDRIPIHHIDENGDICDQNMVIAKINSGKQIRNLFGELEMTSRKKYK